MAPAPDRVALLLLLAECALCLWVLRHIFGEFWPVRWVQDDAYVSFRYARNLALGHGLVYNPGARVEGYSNFLWTILASIPLLHGAEDPLPFLHNAGAVLWAGTYLVVFLFGIRLWAAGLWAAPLFVLPLATHWSFNMWFFSGMETPLVTFLTVVGATFVTLDPIRHRWGPCAASSTAVLLAMARVDGIVTAGALLAAALILDGKRIVSHRRWLSCIVLPFLPLLLVYAPYNLWRLDYYGSVVPNTYYAKAAYLTLYSRGWEYLTMYLSTYHLGAPVLLLLLGAVLVPTGVAGRYLITSLLVAFATAFYVVRLGGDFMEWRFLVPITGLILPASVIGVSLAAGEIASRLAAGAGKGGGSFLAQSANVGRLTAWAAGVAVAVAIALTNRTIQPQGGTQVIGGQETIDLLRRYADRGDFDWRAVGKLLDEVLPANVTIATTSAGIIPYFCNRPCLDLHGLTDPAIARQRVQSKADLRIGHEHWLQDIDEIRQRGVDILLPWAQPSAYPLALTTRPQPDQELVSVRMSPRRYIDFVILNPEAVDRTELDRDPRVVFFGDETIASKHRPYASRQQFARFELIDILDWGDELSEAGHSFQEMQPRDGPYQQSWHTKLLHYRDPLNGVLLEDNGRRIYGEATWKVHGLRAGRELIMVVRHDRTGGGGEYHVEVNGLRLRRLLRARGGDEAWDEETLVIPAGILRQGTNTFRLTRLRRTERDAEFYYMWFLQQGPAVLATTPSDG